MLVNAEVHLSDLYRIIDIPYAEQVNELDWHERAVSTLVPRGLPEFPEQVQDIGVSILREFPADVMQDLLNDVDDPIILSEIRTLRKILMIGRDSVILTVTDPLPEETEPMFRLTKQLGKIRDTQGADVRHVQSARQALIEYAAAVNRPLKRVEPVTVKALRKRCNAKLFPLLTEGQDIKDPNEVHKLRQAFRSVVHLGYISTLVAPSIEIKRCLAEGKQLNEQYGKFHDTVLGIESVV